jgi:hypothetical protein
MATATLEPESPVAVPQYRDARHPLGLPAGSVRCTLCLMIVGLMVYQLVQPPDRLVRIPLALYGLLAMLMIFAAAEGGSVAPPGSGRASPWWLPGWFLRWSLLLGLAGAVGLLLRRRPMLLLERLTPEAGQLDGWPYVLAATGGGFVLGRLFHTFARQSWWFQDILAWVVLLAMAALVVGGVLLTINPVLEEQFQLTAWECVLTALVTFYFGARS